MRQVPLNGSAPTGWAAEYLQQIDDCEARDDQLDDWSRGFLDSLRRQLEGGRAPSGRQVDKLDEIWERATRRG